MIHAGSEPNNYDTFTSDKPSHPNIIHIKITLASAGHSTSHSQLQAGDDLGGNTQQTSHVKINLKLS